MSTIPSVWEVTNPDLAIIRLHGRNHETWNKRGLTSSRPYHGLDELRYPFHDRTITVTQCGRICVRSSTSEGRELDDDTTKPFSVAFKQKMVQRLTGKKAVSASKLAREIGIRQQNLSRWLEEARSLPIMADKPKLTVREWTVAQKARVLAEASKLGGEKLTTYLEGEGVKLAEYEQWRIALEEGGRASAATNKRIRQLEREPDI